MKHLTKWPLLIVIGKPVTEEQANEILIRTNGSYIGTNEREFAKEVNEILFGEPEPGYHVETEAYKALGGLSLNYLQNSRIASYWIGGPHGWCNWDGEIGCNNYNIGKWPEVDEVLYEWHTIAKAFPFLELKAQLVANEGEGEPVVNYYVSNGHVTMEEATERFNSPKAEIDFDLLFTQGREIGVSIERLKKAVNQVKEKIKNPA